MLRLDQAASFIKASEGPDITRQACSTYNTTKKCPQNTKKTSDLQTMLRKPTGEAEHLAIHCATVLLQEVCKTLEWMSKQNRVFRNLRFSFDWSISGEDVCYTYRFLYLYIQAMTNDTYQKHHVWKPQAHSIQLSVGGCLKIRCFLNKKSIGVSFPTKSHTYRISIHPPTDSVPPWDTK